MIKTRIVIKTKLRCPPSLSFWLAKTEITQAQWEAVMVNNPSNFVGTNLPVENVSWEDAKAYTS
jgi:formylglycine-generating enzyme required for sulfatase activity